MKSQPDQKRITLLVVRDAGRPVRQLQLSKPLALALPAAAALSISSLVTSMHFHASRTIAELEAEAAALQLSNVQMEMKVEDKDRSLSELRSQVSELSEEAESIRDKLKNVSELEQQLQSLIDQEEAPDEGDDTASASDTVIPADTLSGALAAADTTGVSAAAMIQAPSIARSMQALSSPLPAAVQFRLQAIESAAQQTVHPQVGGEYIAVYPEDPLQLVKETRDDYEEIRGILDDMLASISTTITTAEEANQAEAQLAAKKALAEKERLAKPVLWPTVSKVITSSFGYRSDPFKGVSAYHSGIDIAGNIGDPIYAAMDGEVTASDQMGARGKYIILKHKNGLETWYMHLNGMTVSVGDQVKKGQKIGTLGNTGRSTGPHLHFQVVKQNQAVNPLSYVKP